MTQKSSVLLCLQNTWPCNGNFRHCISPGSTSCPLAVWRHFQACYRTGSQSEYINHVTFHCGAEYTLEWRIWAQDTPYLSVRVSDVQTIEYSERTTIVHSTIIVRENIEVRGLSPEADSPDNAVLKAWPQTVEPTSQRLYRVWIAQGDA
jgi:hypothetical protein